MSMTENPLPPDWSYDRLDSMVFVDRESLSSATPRDYSFRYIDITSASEGKLEIPSTEITFSEAPSRARRVVHQGDVLMSTVRPNLKAFAYFDRPAENYVASTGFAVLTAKEEADSRFVLYSILSEDVGSQIEQYVVGSNYPAINSSDVKRLRVARPPLPEQRKIARILSTVDDLIERTEALIAKHRAIKQGLMHDLLTRGVDASGRLRPPREEAPRFYRESAVGWVPREWTVVPVGDVFDMRLGKMLSKASKTGQNSYPYVANRSVQWDYVDLSELDEMDFTESEREKYALQPGDLLVCEGGEVGRTAIWRGEMVNCYFQKAIHRLRPKDDRALPTYMLRYMHFAADTGRLTRYTSQSSITHLTGEKLMLVPISLPPRDEQLRIVAALDSMDSQIRIEQAGLEKLAKTKAGLMQDLLTGLVRVKV